MVAGRSSHPRIHFMALIFQGLTLRISLLPLYGGLLVAALFSPTIAASDLLDVKLVRVHDGDTIIVDLPKTIPPLFGDDMPVRLYGIDAPEMNSKDGCEKSKALQARNLLTQLLSGKRIDLRNVKRDKYFRINADVFANGIQVKDALLQKHLAYPYFGETKQKINWCKY